MKNQIFFYSFFCVNVCVLRICHLLHIFLLDIQCTTFDIESRVSKEQIVILLFAHNLLLLT